MRVPSYEFTSLLSATVPPYPAAQSLSNPEDSLEYWDDHTDWDSIIKDWSCFHHDDSLSHVLNTTTPTPVSPSNPFDPHIPHLPQSPDSSLSHQIMGGNYNTNSSSSFDHHLVHHNHTCQTNGFDFIDELIKAADCFDTNQPHLAQVILDRLNQRLRSPVGKPLHRAAFYFKEALHSLLSGSNRTPRVSSMVEIVHTIRTFKAFSAISPIPMFSIFTTNQALLESLHDHGSPFIHIIDFEIGLGIHYASLMKEIAAKFNSPVLLLRITAIVPENYALVQTKLVRENLNQFANDLKIRVQTEFVLFQTLEETSLTNAVKFVDGENTAVLLSPAVFRRLGSTEKVADFLGDIRRVSPSVVVFVDGEGWGEEAEATSFGRSLEFYAMVLGSLDASAVGGGDDWIRRIEMFLLRPKMVAAVEGRGRRIPAWREVFYGAGMRAVQLSRFVDFQAECLLARLQVNGFHVAKRQAELVLFWNQRPIVSTSAWRC